MLLSARILSHVDGINSWEVVDSAEWTQGDSTSLYLQLTDASIDRAERGFNPPGRRYCPVSGATLQVKINSIDSTKTFTKTATQPFPGDTSIWKIDIAAADGIQGSPDLLLVLTESGVVKRGRVANAIRVHAQQESF